MMQRQCICGKKIKVSQEVCADCYATYGPDRAQWPEWLRDWITSTQNELNAERNHLEHELHDETTTPGTSRGHKTKAENAKGGGMTYDAKSSKFVSNLDTMAIVFPGSPYDNTRVNQRSKYDDDSLGGLTPQAQSAAIWSKNGDRIYNNLADSAMQDDPSEEKDVQTLLESLPERERKVADMLMDGKKEREIAAELGVSQQMVSKIKDKLRKLVVKWQGSCSN